jgi:hypothetical protein
MQWSYREGYALPAGFRGKIGAKKLQVLDFDRN